MPKEAEYEQINICLYELGFILKSMGVTEFSISKDKRSVIWDTQKEIDSEILDKLCAAVSSIYEEVK
jgi:hypothetical protein